MGEVFMSLNSYHTNSNPIPLPIEQFVPSVGYGPIINTLPPSLANVANYIAQECNVGIGWAIASTLSAIGISSLGTVNIRMNQHWTISLLPSFILLGERATGKDRTIELAINPIRAWEKKTGQRYLSAQRSYTQQMRETFEHGEFSAVVDGELDSISNLFSQPNIRGEILEEMEGRGRGYISKRCKYEMEAGKLALLCGAQPAIFAEKIKRYRMEENGFLSRCCIVNHQSYLYDGTTISNDGYNTFENRISEILDASELLHDNHSYIELTLEEGDLPLWNNFKNELRGYYYPREKLVSGWKSRAIAHAAKIAAIFSLYENPKTEIISTEMSLKAFDMLRWLYNETCIAYNWLFPEQGTYEAGLIAGFLKASHIQFIPKNDLELAMAKDISSPRKFKAGLSILLHQGVIYPNLQSDGKNGRPRNGFYVNIFNLNNIYPY